MGPTSLNLSVSGQVAAPVLARAQTGLSPITAPQGWTAGANYAFGAAPAGLEFTADMVIFLAVTLAPGGTRTVNLPAGTETDPTGYSPARIGTLKVLQVWVARKNPDDASATPADGVTVAANDSLAAAMGYTTGAVSKTMIPGQQWLEETPLGRGTRADATLTLANLSATDRTTVYVALGGFQP